MGMTCNIKAVITPNGALKVLELVLAFICVGLLKHYDLAFASKYWAKAETVENHTMLGLTAIGSSILITLPCILAYIFCGHSFNNLEGLYCFSLSVLNATAGAMAIENYRKGKHDPNTPAGYALGALMIINALVYLIDSFVGTFVSRNKK